MSNNITSMKEPDYIIYGGLKVDKNMIASAKKVRNDYIIDFKNGQSIRYPQQAFGAELVNQECHGSHGERPQMLLFNVSDATITGRDGMDSIVLKKNCHNNTVVLDNDENQDDSVQVETISTLGDDLKKHPNTNNKFQLGNNDILTFYDLKSKQVYHLSGPDIINQNKLDVEF